MGKSAVAKAKDMGLSENGVPPKLDTFSIYQHLCPILSSPFPPWTARLRRQEVLPQHQAQLEIEATGP